MLRSAIIALAIMAGSIIIAATIAIKPTGFERCVAMIAAETERQAAQTAATLNPREVEATAARACANGGEAL